MLGESHFKLRNVPLTPYRATVMPWWMKDIVMCALGSIVVDHAGKVG